MSVSSRSVAHHEANAISSNSRTDWERIGREAEADIPVPYDPTDPDDGPCDPNDAAATEAHWRLVKRPVQVVQDTGPLLLEQIK